MLHALSPLLSAISILSIADQSEQPTHNWLALDAARTPTLFLDVIHLCVCEEQDRRSAIPFGLEYRLKH